MKITLNFTDEFVTKWAISCGWRRDEIAPEEVSESLENWMQAKMQNDIEKFIKMGGTF